MPRSHPAPRRRSPRAAALLAAAAAVGCAADEQESIFSEISRLPAQEQLVEVELGHFMVPVPIVIEGAGVEADPKSRVDRFQRANLMEVQFRLFAVVDPKQQQRVEKLAKRNEGRLRDQVITVCRETPRDDLAEAQWATLKAHLLDAIQPLLGGPAVRRLGVTQVLKEEL